MVPSQTPHRWQIILVSTCVQSHPSTILSHIETISLISSLHLASVISTVGCTNGTSIEDTISCLRGASVGALVAAVNHLKNGQPNVIIDGDFLPELPSYLITSGNFSKLDSFIGGHCTNDGRTFAGGSPSNFVTDEDVETLVFKRWPEVVR
jgi:hypothetical protein